MVAHMWKKILLNVSIITLSATFLNATSKKQINKLANTVVLIIRHAEEPDIQIDPGLSSEGYKRAQRYAHYFNTYLINGSPDKPTVIYAAESKHRIRPRLTMVSIATKLEIPINKIYSYRRYKKLVQNLKKRNNEKCILICWNHRYIPKLVKALGADPIQLWGQSKWPDDVFCWLIQLRYDEKAHLIDSQCINVDLLHDEKNDDSNFPVPLPNP